MQKIYEHVTRLYNLLTLHNKEINKLIRENDEDLREIDLYLPDNTIFLKDIDLKFYHEKIGLNNILIRRFLEVKSLPNNTDEIRDLYNNLKEIKEKIKPAVMLEIVSSLLPKMRVDDFSKIEDIIIEYVKENTHDRYITLEYFNDVQDMIQYFGLDNFKYKFTTTQFTNGLVPHYNKIINLLEKIENNRKSIYNNFMSEINGYKSINDDYCKLMHEIFGEKGLYGKIIVDISNLVLSTAFNNILGKGPDKYFYELNEKVDEIISIISSRNKAMDTTKGIIIKDV